MSTLVDDQQIVIHEPYKFHAENNHTMSSSVEDEVSSPYNNKSYPTALQSYEPFRLEHKGYTSYKGVFCSVGENHFKLSVANPLHHMNAFIKFENLSWTLKEIITDGCVSYLKNFSYCMIDRLKISITNPCGLVTELVNYSGEDIFRTLDESSKQTFSKLNDKFCVTREGFGKDFVVFPEERISIPFDVLPQRFFLYDQTTLQIELVLHDMEHVLVYDTVAKKAMTTKMTNQYPRDISLSYSVLAKPFDPEATGTLVHCSLNRSFSPHKSILGSTGSFDSALALLIYTKPDHMKRKHEYLFNPENDSSAKDMMKKALKNFRDDLVITEETFVTLPKEYQECYVDITEKNKHVFTIPEKSTCHILIRNKPQNIRFFFHTQVMSYSRRSQAASTVNISQMIREIEVLYTPEKLLTKITKHCIPLLVMCLPLNCWRDPSNTSKGDMRLERSKKKNFFFANSFLNSFDFLEQTSLLESVTPINTANKNDHRPNDRFNDYLLGSTNNCISIPVAPYQKPLQPDRFLNKIELQHQWAKHSELINLLSCTIVYEFVQLKEYAYKDKTITAI